jgi:hypothetical protein
LGIENLYDKYELPLLRYAKSLTSDKETAEDAYNNEAHNNEEQLSNIGYLKI